MGVGTGETTLSRMDNFTDLVVTFSFETVSFCLPAGLKLVTILLPPGPTCWDYWHEPPHQHKLVTVDLSVK